MKPSGLEPVSDQEAAAFAARARRLLLESAGHLDGRTRSRLAQARYAALAQVAANDSGRSFKRWMLPAGSIAAIALGAFLWLGGTQPDRKAMQAASPPIDDLELMAGAENFELIEDLEFYAWLESEAVLPDTREPASSETTGRGTG